MAKPTCCWVKRAASPGVQPVYCGAAVQYEMKVGDDGHKARKYHSFCPLHEQELLQRKAIGETWEQEPTDEL